MHRLLRQLAVSNLLGATLLFAQTSVPGAHSIPGTEDGTASYRIYSSLIPLGETASKTWPHDLWLVEDKTVAVVPQDQPCVPRPASTTDRHFDLGMNPHTAVHPPDRWRQDFEEILEDFDEHCHERLDLDPDPKLWNLSAPLRLLTPEEQKEFQSTRYGKTPDAQERYKGAPALYAFSEVYFNTRHTVALVYARHWCGGLCGQGLWIAVALENGHWKRLPWNATSWIS